MVRNLPGALAFAPLLVGLASAGMPSIEGARVLDGNALLHERPYVVLSPNREQVAYVSKGHVVFCNVLDPQPKRLGAVPGSWTEILARPENAHALGNSHVLLKKLGREERSAFYNKLSRVVDLQWTHDSESVVWGLQRFVEGDVPADPRQPPSRVGQTEYWIATTAGEKRPMLTTRRGGARITRDRRYSVANAHSKALIWDLKANRPRATPYLRLTASSTSDRWIGLEKDTRQLVILDADFEVVQRFEEFMPKLTFGSELLWSPDERYALLRNQIGFDHYSNWKGFCLDLETGEKLPLEGWFMREDFAFTGRGDEFYRCGVSGKRNPQVTATIVTGAHFTLYPSLIAEPIRLLEVQYGTRNHNAAPSSPGPYGVFASADAECFLLCQSGPGNNRWEWRWRLCDREGALRPLAPEAPDLAAPSVRIAGFAKGDREVIAYDRTGLFALPVSPPGAKSTSAPSP
ncbi:hypothetical protein MalM25_24710 [Planctomycetes bacterium MalM25]|nr:hypothetical protein MalM25_24710 [Planctomycetes bacterium MalM25]